MSSTDEKDSSDANATETTESTKTEPIEALIYCGPNLPNGTLNQFTVYRGGIPKHLNKVIEKCPAVNRLFVPVNDLTKTLQSINETGTSQNIWFKQIVQFVQGGVKA